MMRFDFLAARLCLRYERGSDHARCGLGNEIMGFVSVIVEASEDINFYVVRYRRKPILVVAALRRGTIDAYRRFLSVLRLAIPFV